MRTFYSPLTTHYLLPSYLQLGGREEVPLGLGAPAGKRLIFLKRLDSRQPLAACPVPAAGKMLEVIGAICSTSVQYIVPGGCYFVLFPGACQLIASRLPSTSV